MRKMTLLPKGILPLIEIAVVFAFFVSACQPAGPAQCPTTKPNGKTPPGEQPSPLHHGNGQLFTALWPQGVIDLNESNPEVYEGDGSVTVKFPWWRGQGVEGPLIIQGELISDGPGDFGAIIPEGYGSTGFQASGLIFSQPGCWRVLGRSGQAKLEFVTLVVDQESN